MHVVSGEDLGNHACSYLMTHTVSHSKDRSKLHISAVFQENKTNHRGLTIWEHHDLVMPQKKAARMHVCILCHLITLPPKTGLAVR